LNEAVKTTFADTLKLSTFSLAILLGCFGWGFNAKANLEYLNAGLSQTSCSGTTCNVTATAGIATSSLLVLVTYSTSTLTTIKWSLDNQNFTLATSTKYIGNDRRINIYYLSKPTPGAGTIQTTKPSESTTASWYQFGEVSSTNPIENFWLYESQTQPNGIYKWWGVTTTYGGSIPGILHTATSWSLITSST